MNKYHVRIENTKGDKQNLLSIESSSINGAIVHAAKIETMRMSRISSTGGSVMRQFTATPVGKNLRGERIESRKIQINY